MSSTLTWQPIQHNSNSLDDDLKFSLRKRYGDPVNAILSCSDIPYLQGLRDAGIKDAIVLLNAIDSYDRISIREEY